MAHDGDVVRHLHALGPERLEQPQRENVEGGEDGIWPRHVAGRGFRDDVPTDSTSPLQCSLCPEDMLGDQLTADVLACLLEADQAVGQRAVDILGQDDGDAPAAQIVQMPLDSR